MAAKASELVGVYLGEKHRWDNTVIAEVEEYRPGEQASLFAPSVSIKGVVEVGELEHGQTYRFYGRWSSYYNRKSGDSQKQFVFDTFIRSQPHGETGVIAYLKRAPHIGHATARAIWDKFGSESVRTLRESPETIVRTVKAKQFTLEKAQEAADFLESDKALEACTIDLIDLLNGRGFRKSIFKDAIRVWGNRAASLIRKNPYLLMRFRAGYFHLCDSLYLSLGLPRTALKRQALCVWYTISRNKEGHTWFPVDEVVKGLYASVSGANVTPPLALMLAKRGKLVSTRWDDAGQLWLAEQRKAANEAYIAERVAKLLRCDDPLQWPATKTGDEHQEENLRIATSAHVGLLGGSPGTGKSFSCAAIIRAVLTEHGWDACAAAAPTGKAAVRVTEMLQGYGIELKARTIHSLLGVASLEDGSGWSFRHHEGDPLPYRFIFIDEGSMADTDLAASLLSACSVGTHLLIVGDVNQLPPVGHGAPLRDLIAGGVPYGELTKIRRNSGTIVRVCSAIRNGDFWQPADRIDWRNEEDPQNLRIVEASKPEQQIEKMKAAIGAAKADGFDPIWDVQVLVPVNKASPLARKTINKLLQAELNPSGYGVVGSPFRVADKVVCLKNGFYPIDDKDPGEATISDGKVFIANGEIGRVIAVAEKLTTVQLTGPNRIIKVPRGTSKDDDSEEDSSGAGCDWDLAFSISGHKSQGSEWPVVIVLLDEYPGARMVCDRSWIYTAISRAKKLCFLVGKKATADTMCRRHAIAKRKTFLKELLQEELSKEEPSVREDSHESAMAH